MDIPFEQRFHFRDGSSVKSLEELKAKIEAIGYQEFYHHVNADKNDFANWVQNVLRNERLATDLRRVTSIVETVEIISDHLHPRPVTAQHNDLQSHIEDTVLQSPLHAETDDRVVVEQMPVAPTPREKLDFRIIEEKLGIRDGVAGTNDEPIPAKVKDELFGKVPGPEPPVHVSADTTTLIIKDFMIGFVLGIVIGFLIGRIF